MLYDLKDRLREISSTIIGKIILFVAVVFITATLFLLLMLYSFSRKPPEKQRSNTNQNSLTPTLEIKPTEPIANQILPSPLPLNYQFLLAVIDNDNKFLEQNDFESLYANSANNLKETYTPEGIKAFLKTKLAPDFKILTARRATDPLFYNNLTQVTIIVTYQTGEIVKQQKLINSYTFSDGVWRLSSIN